MKTNNTGAVRMPANAKGSGIAEIKCPQCGSFFEPNHRQRIYCSNACKDEYYNRQKRKDNMVQRTVEQCEETLCTLLGEQKRTVVTYDKLIEKDFVFEANTQRHEVNPKRGKFVLQYGVALLRRIDLELFEITKIENYERSKEIK